jgi:hypothetical protein
VDDPLEAAGGIEERDSVLAAAPLQRHDHLLGEPIGDGPELGIVGMMWSTVAKVRSGNRTGRPISSSIAKAWGLVTSWIRCRPMKSWVCPSGSSRTLCRSQTLSRRLLAFDMMGM